MLDLTWIDDLKIRGGWGKQEINQESAIMPIFNYIIFNGFPWWETGNDRAVVNITPANMRNRDLTWETTTQSNIGIDLTCSKIG